MVIRGSNHCYPNGSQNYGVSEESIDPNSSTHRTSFIYNFSILKEKVEQVESLASSIFMPPHHPDDQMAMDTLIQEIIVTASSMMFACQHMSLNNAALAPPAASAVAEESGPSTAFFATHQDTVDHWYKYNNKEDGYQKEPPRGGTGETAPVKEYDVVEVEAADLLAKYTHYCQVCGKGFKRDANLRMHMRAHGEEYKSSAALSNPMKSGGGGAVPPRKYSCPQEGCRWNKKHARFQPLKSMICVKNHYKRSHCPKMYVCKRCNRKQFSVLSDLRTHEKHCGDLKWQCSCGTTFSRKDKLMGHVALFVGHSPVFI